MKVKLQFSNFYQTLADKLTTWSFPLTSAKELVSINIED